MSRVATLAAAALWSAVCVKRQKVCNVGMIKSQAVQCGFRYLSVHPDVEMWQKVTKRISAPNLRHIKQKY